MVCTKKSAINTRLVAMLVSQPTHTRDLILCLSQARDKMKTRPFVYSFERMCLVYFMHNFKLNTKILHKEKVLPYSYGQLNDLILSVPPLNHQLLELLNKKLFFKINHKLYQLGGNQCFALRQMFMTNYGFILIRYFGFEVVNLLHYKRVYIKEDIYQTKFMKVFFK